MISICMLNQKGGAGKSTMVFHLAGALRRGDVSVLLVDADPQGSLSKGFFGAREVESLASRQTLAALLDQDSLAGDPMSLVHPTGVDGLSVVRANQHLAAFNTPRPECTGMQQYALAGLVERAAHSFDAVLFDCPPNLYLCSWAALVACRHVLIPVPPEDFGAQGLAAVHQAVEQAAQLNPELRLLGHIITRRDRRLVIHDEYEQRLRDQLGDAVLESVIPELTAFKTAVTCRTPVELSEPRSDAAEAMRLCCAEVLGRILRADDHTDSQAVSA